MENQDELGPQYGTYTEEPIPAEKEELNKRIIKAIEDLLSGISLYVPDYNTIEFIIHTKEKSFTVGAKFFKKRKPEQAGG